MSQTGSFELLYAELEDLDRADPMRQAALVHAFGAMGERCYDAIHNQYSTYVIGRGPLPAKVGAGYFLTACRPDYPLLQKALSPFWPGMPRFPKRRSRGAGAVYSQEYSDVLNYIAKSPQPDPTILDEARERLQGLVSVQHAEATARVCKWLVENMSPANNCYTLSALFVRWLAERGIPACYHEGKATLYRVGKGRVTIEHAWVEIQGAVCDLTLNRQDEWGDLGEVFRIRVEDKRLAYLPKPDVSWKQHWRRFSRPASRPAYTPVSQRRQSRMIRAVLPRDLYQARRPWITQVRMYGILEGTYRFLNENT